MSVQILHGDCLTVLRTMPSESINCCVTSPPYWGLRDYGVEGQLGLERTPEEYVSKMVEVFREVRRVLRDDGTLWLNLGDSYKSNPPCRVNPQSFQRDGSFTGGSGEISHPLNCGNIDGLKPKDLVGIPWTVAKAMRDPYYSGKIKEEKDRAWMAAMMDGEGCICGFVHDRKDDGRTRTGIHITITNSSVALLDEAYRIWPVSKKEHNHHGEGHYGSLPTMRWIVHGTENKILFLREIYPYLIAKKVQALLAYNLLVFQKNAKHYGQTSQKEEINDKRKYLCGLISNLNKQQTVDIPEWCVEPSSVLEPGWFLRQDIIWSKPNPMPESVTDRCTKAHEYIFLMSKSQRYFYDAVAVKEASIDPESLRPEGRNPRNNDAFTQSNADSFAATRTGFSKLAGVCYPQRNRRSVWTVSTAPFPGAHFATFPPKLIEPCILAGCPAQVCAECGAPWERIFSDRKGGIEGDWHSSRKTDGFVNTKPSGQKAWDSYIAPQTVGFQPSCKCNTLKTRPGVVLDPFGGSGTVGMVAENNGRNSILIELNPKYVDMAKRRTAQIGLFN